MAGNEEAVRTIDDLGYRETAFASNCALRFDGKAQPYLIRKYKISKAGSAGHNLRITRNSLREFTVNASNLPTYIRNINLFRGFDMSQLISLLKRNVHANVYRLVCIGDRFKYISEKLKC